MQCRDGTRRIFTDQADIALHQARRVVLDCPLLIVYALNCYKLCARGTLVVYLLKRVEGVEVPPSSPCRKVPTLRENVISCARFQWLFCSVSFLGVRLGCGFCSLLLRAQYVWYFKQRFFFFLVLVLLCFVDFGRGTRSVKRSTS